MAGHRFGMNMASRNSLYCTKKVCWHSGFSPWSQGHWQFSTVIQVAALSMVHTGAITPVFNCS